MRKKRTEDDSSSPQVELTIAETQPAGLSVPECLSPDHLRQIELASAKVEEMKLKRRIAEQDIVIAELLLERKRQSLAQESANQQSAIRARTELVTSFKSTYEITDSLAYDPDTGKIVR